MQSMNGSSVACIGEGVEWRERLGIVWCFAQRTFMPFATIFLYCVRVALSRWSPLLLRDPLLLSTLSLTLGGIHNFSVAACCCCCLIARHIYCCFLGCAWPCWPPRRMFIFLLATSATRQPTKQMVGHSASMSLSRPVSQCAKCFRHKKKLLALLRQLLGRLTAGNLFMHSNYVYMCIFHAKSLLVEFRCFCTTYYYN